MAARTGWADLAKAAQPPAGAPSWPDLPGAMRRMPPGLTETAASATTEIGSVGVAVFAGRVFDEFMPALAGDQALRVWREMSDNDPVVGSFLFGIDQLVRKVPWTVAPADGDQATDVAELVEGCMGDMETPWPDVMSAAFSMIPYGWSWLETVMKRRGGMETDDPAQRSRFDDGRYGWRKWSLRVQQTRWRWETDEHDDVVGLWQSAPPNYVPTFIPRNRCAHFRTTAARGNPEGRSVLRSSWLPWWRKKNVERLESIGIERDLVGMPMAGVPSAWLSDKATPDEKRAAFGLLKVLTNLRRDEQEGFLYPLDYDDNNNQKVKVELLKAPGAARMFDTDQIISRYDQRIAMPVLADFILLGHEKVGSYNLGESKVDLFAAALDAWLLMVAAEANATQVPRLCKLNGIPAARSPMLKPGNITTADLDRIGKLLAAMAAAGATPLAGNDTLVQHLLREADLPDDLPTAATP